jgi:medium-chain acyl-[acyl-carrier-protein] hydrolase
MTVPPPARTALSPWIEYLEPVPQSHAVLVCVPHAGGAASGYRPWARRLAEVGIEVWPVQLPGREGRFSEPFQRDLDELADAVIDRLAAHRAGRPYAIYGHSAGAYAAWRVAMAAEASVPGLAHLFVGASRPPSHPDPAFPIHRLPPDAFLSRLLEYGRIPEELLQHDELVELTTTTARADLRLVEDYAWPREAMLTCPVTALCGVRDTTVPVTSQHGWQSITTGPFAEVSLPGGHFPPPLAEEQILEVVRRAFE